MSNFDSLIFLSKNEKTILLNFDTFQIAGIWNWSKTNQNAKCSLKHDQTIDPLTFILALISKFLNEQKSTNFYTRI